MENQKIVKSLERAVVATNTCLRDVVSSMDVLTLLRNVHPFDRTDFVYLCRDAGLIHPTEVQEFIVKREVKTRFR